jgi:hypothetical protein
MAQDRTTAEDLLIRKAPRLNPVTRLEVVSRNNPNDIRAVIDTGARDYDQERVKLVDGSVTVDVNADTLRSVSVTVQDRTGRLFPGPGAKLWLDASLRPYRGFQGTQLWPQGVFDVADPEVTDTGQVRIAGQDKSSRANGRDCGGFLEVVELAKDLNIATAIKTLAAYRTWGETLFNLDLSTTATLPYKQKYGLTDYPWPKAVAIAGIPGNYRPLHYDERGRLTWFVDPDPNLLAPVVEIWPGNGRPTTALPGEFAKYISASKQIDAHGLKNWIGVKGGSAKANPVFAYAADEDAASPTAVQNIGYRISWWNSGNPDPLITTVAEAQARADYELRRLKQWHERVPLRIGLLPYLQPWDVIRVISPGMRVNDTYQVVSYTLPLVGAEMQLQGWRTRKAVA